MVETRPPTGWCLTWPAVEHPNPSSSRLDPVPSGRASSDAATSARSPRWPWASSATSVPLSGVIPRRYYRGMTQDDEAAWGDRLGRMMPLIRQMEARRDVEDVAPGSPLARDDEDYPELPTSTLAWVGLITATEHLGMAADLLESDHPRAFPTAYQTLCRTAMLGAGQAIWLLTGNQRERTHRSRRVAFDEHMNHRAFLKDWTHDAFLGEEVSSEMLGQARAAVERIDQRMKALRARMKADGWTAREQAFSATQMLKDVATYLAADDEWLRINGTWQWRMGSGDAHARLWPRRIRRGERIPLLDGSGTHILVSTGSLDQIGMVVATAVMATQEAFRLWDERRAAPSS